MIDIFGQHGGEGKQVMVRDLAAEPHRCTQSQLRPQIAVGNMAGIVAPLLTGWIVKETGRFLYAFIMVAVMLAIGSASYLFVVGPIEPIAWRSKRLVTHS